MFDPEGNPGRWPASKVCSFDDVAVAGRWSPRGKIYGPVGHDSRSCDPLSCEDIRLRPFFFCFSLLNGKHKSFMVPRILHGRGGAAAWGDRAAGHSLVGWRQQPESPRPRSRRLAGAAPEVVSVDSVLRLFSFYSRDLTPLKFDLGLSVSCRFSFFLFGRKSEEPMPLPS